MIRNIVNQNYNNNKFSSIHRWNDKRFREEKLICWRVSRFVKKEIIRSISLDEILSIDENDANKDFPSISHFFIFLCRD